MDEATIKKYARLLVVSGGNVQKGQPVVITCSVDDAAFARMVEAYAYEAGAEEVAIDWFDDLSNRARYLHGADSIFDSYPQWRVDRFKYFDDRGAVYLHIRSSDPDALAGVDADRILRNTRAYRTAVKAHTALTMSNRRRWSIIAVPSVAWAKKVFPGVPEDEAVELLWTRILKAARADGDDPVRDWEIHKQNFQKNVDYLNNKAFKALHFTNSLGTDLTVGLVKHHVWRGGGDTAQDGIDFFPNMPTEEIFTMPDKHVADGRVVASMPLCYQGNLIEGFEVTYEKGRAVSWRADANEAVLSSILHMDEGARRLGEVALVTNSSPIAQMRTLFYETLFDENASCHFAFGRAYPDNIEGGVDMTEAQLAEAGANDSLTHVDFMFGTPDMKITGISEDGSETVFFCNGEFVI